MKKFRIHSLKFFAFLALLVMGSLSADVHADEYKPKQAHDCCITCCPAHHLAPSQSSASYLVGVRPTWQETPVIHCLSIDVTPFIFHPPQTAS